MNPEHARLLRWEDLKSDRPMPLIQRRRVMGERMMVSRVALARGFEVPVHSHENEQIVVVISGRCSFILGSGEAIEVRGGDVLVLPSGTPHGCRALEDTDILDLFSPVSEKTGVDRD